jgi:hypothetical protein
LLPNISAISVDLLPFFIISTIITRSPETKAMFSLYFRNTLLMANRYHLSFLIFFTQEINISRDHSRIPTSSELLGPSWNAMVMMSLFISDNSLQETRQTDVYILGHYHLPVSSPNVTGCSQQKQPAYSVYKQPLSAFTGEG